MLQMQTCSSLIVVTNDFVFVYTRTNVNHKVENVVL